MATVYSYLRFSTPDQIKGDSQRRQLELTLAWVEAEGHTLDKSLDLRDLGVSAFRGKNAQKYGEGQLGLFLECIETGRVQPGSILAVESLDRITRQQLDDAHQLVRKILKAGVSIKTFSPDDFLTPEDVNNPFKTMMALMILTRAHEESKIKSDRLKAAWVQKRKKAAEQILTSLGPAWAKAELAPNGSVAVWHVIPERAAIVQRIFRLARDGYGINSIAKVLNGEEIPAFRGGKGWGPSTIRRYLRDRVCLGEYNPHVNRDEKRVPVGEPIKGYYPQIIDEELFYSVQQSLDDRRGTGGKAGDNVTNLFQGLVRDARDGSVMHIVNKGKKSTGPQLVSSSANRGKPGSVYLGFSYAKFEQSLFVWAWDLKLGDVIPRKATNLEAEHRKTEGQLADIKNRISTIQNRIKTAKNVESLIDVLLSLEDDKNAAEEKLSRLRSEMASTESEAMDRTKELIQEIQTADDDQLFSLRMKLRATIRRLVDDVVLLVFKVNSDRVAIADVKLKNGNRRKVTIFAAGLVSLPDGIDSLDVRKWSEWPEDLKKERFTRMRNDVKRMIELEKQGLTRTEIAKEMGISKTSVSRWLVRSGHRKKSNPGRPPKSNDAGEG